MPTDSSRATPFDERFDRIACIAAAWFLIGLYADGWSHYHDVRESFFTPYHAILYAGYFVNVALYAVTFARNRAAGCGWRVALPPGYNLSALGCAIFTLGIIPDFAWHRIFGIEEGIDVLVSPTHLFLGTGMALVLAGPLRSALRRRDRPLTLRAQLPMIVSLALVLAEIQFALQFVYDPGITLPNAPLDPLMAERPRLAFFLLPFTYYKEALGIAIIVIHAALTTGFTLFAIRNFALRRGALTILFGSIALLMAVLLADSLLSAYVTVADGVLTGAVADVLLVRLRPSVERPTAFRLFAIVFPVVQYTLFFGSAMYALGGIWWDVNMASGSVIYAAVTGLLLSFLALPAGPRQAA